MTRMLRCAVSSSRKPNSKGTSRWWPVHLTSILLSGAEVQWSTDRMAMADLVMAVWVKDPNWFLPSNFKLNLQVDA
jgi:hypothetical protein